MAPKVKKTATKAKASSGKPKPKPDAKEKALLQANLASQAKNAKNKLEDAKSGKVVVGDEEMAQLQCKVDFFEAYKKLPRDSEGKNEMLEQFTMDKTCQRWAERTKVVDSTQAEKATAQSGYKSRDWFDVKLFFHTQKTPFSFFYFLSLKTSFWEKHCFVSRNRSHLRFRNCQRRRIEHERPTRKEAIGFDPFPLPSRCQLG